MLTTEENNAQESLKSSYLVPHQRTGARTGATSKLELPTRHDAIVQFNDAGKRLLDINNWRRLCGDHGAEFQLTDDKGAPIAAAPKAGDLIRIRLPAPANASGDGYDWVRIEAFENSKDLIKDMDIFGFRVRPAQNPLSDVPEQAHFYTGSATSTFLVIRRASVVWVVERGRNERPNTSASSFWNKLRNLLISLAAMMGFSSPQWKQLVTGILKGPPADKRI